ncbi:bifunctional diguanylate cyclase/phosphodiesterase [Cellulomonas citrea]|uniref:bifunctional diguanylate cyclase/phosphodiesterase n=1 Tax=Cellulomonas citrea TaxID=1909423 RepID=UPI00135C25C7|nr:EAL domain-containing protein [Cellulomonas citrea]
MAPHQHDPDGPVLTLAPGTARLEPLRVNHVQVPDLLSAPLEVLARQTPLLLTVDETLRVSFVTGRQARPGCVGLLVADAFADLPVLVGGLRAAAVDGLVRRFDLELGGRTLDVVVQPVLSDDRVRGLIAATTDVTAARASVRRTALLARMTAEHAAVQDDPDAVMDLIVRAIAEYVRAPVLLRTYHDGALVLQAAEDLAAPDRELLRSLVEEHAPARACELSDEVLSAGGPVTVPWSVWQDQMGVPEPVRSAMAHRRARAVVCWPMRVRGQLVGLLTVVAVGDSRMRVDSDPSEQRFLGDVAARAALHLEAAQLRAAASRSGAALAESEARFRSAFAAAPVGMVLAGADPEQPGRVIAVNDAYAALVGRPADELVGVLLPDLAHPLDADEVESLLTQVADGEVPQGTREHRVLNPDGSIGWVRMSVGLAAADGAGGARQLIGHVEDITTRIRAQEELARRALYDGLTGLANRHLATDHLRRAVAGLRRGHGRVAVLFADLDRFKAINDTFGHDVGDQVLVEVGARLQAVVREQDVAARIGGDEFLLVSQDVATDESLTALLEAVLAALDPPVSVLTAAGTTPLNVGVSVGVSLATSSNTRPELMLHQADTAMYEAKRLGRHRYQVFTESLGQPASRWLRVERDLRAAMAEDRMVLHYQPIVELGTGQVRGVEALLRMVDPVRGLVPPGEFIDVAEESALTYSLGRWVVEEACRQLAVWQQLPRDGRPLVMAVNVTGRQLEDAARSGSVLAAASTLQPQSLCLEVTERMLLDAADSVVADLEGLAAAGIRLAIDDFGTGYSSLTYLQRFPVHALKIDRSFVSGLGANARDDAIVASVVALGATLGLEVVAEGIETADQLQALSALGCPAGQGFLLARPMPAEEMTKLLVATGSGTTSPR